MCLLTMCANCATNSKPCYPCRLNFLAMYVFINCACPLCIYTKTSPPAMCRMNRPDDALLMYSNPASAPSPLFSNRGDVRIEREANAVSNRRLWTQYEIEWRGARVPTCFSCSTAAHPAHQRRWSGWRECAWLVVLSSISLCPQQSRTSEIEWLGARFLYGRHKLSQCSRAMERVKRVNECELIVVVLSMYLYWK
jgi:hypothetical protein